MKINKMELEQATGNLFGKLWNEYNDKEFEHSVDLFLQRMRLIGEPLDVIKEGKVLDAGCGGGRNSIGLKLAGAKSVIGIDVGREGLQDAEKRAKLAGFAEEISFQYASIQDLPFDDASFDLVWCAGVLMIVDNESAALDELLRVLKPGGTLYLLVYATEGMRWPLINLLRPLCANIGESLIDSAIRLANLNSASRRTFLDDLFCPKLDFYTWERLNRMLEKRKVQQITRLGAEIRMDHESGIEEYLLDLERLHSIFESGKKANLHRLFEDCSQIVSSAILSIKSLRLEASNLELLNQAIGQGHHRVLVRK